MSQAPAPRRHLDDRPRYLILVGQRDSPVTQPEAADDPPLVAIPVGSRSTPGPCGFDAGSSREPAAPSMSLACLSTSRVNRYWAYPKMTAAAKTPAPLWGSTALKICDCTKSTPKRPKSHLVPISVTRA